MTHQDLTDAPASADLPSNGGLLGSGGQLTPFAVRAAQCPKPGEPRRVIWDGGSRLGLSLSHRSRTWIVESRGPDGRSVRRTIGDADGPGALSLADARRLARRVRAAIERGEPPPTIRKFDAPEPPQPADPALPVFDKVRDAYLDSIEHTKRHRDYKQYLNRGELAPWEGKPLAEITRSDVRAVATAVLATIAARAERRKAQRQRAGRESQPGELR